MGWRWVAVCAAAATIVALTPGAGGAFIEPTVVKVTPNGPVPHTIRIPTRAATVAWVNDGATATRVVIRGVPCEAVDSAYTTTQTFWACAFPRAGRYPYKIEGLPAGVASGVVVATRVRRAPTLDVSRRAVTFGTRIALSGLVPTGYFGVPVTELRERVVVLSRTVGPRYRMLTSTISGLPVHNQGRIGWQVEAAPRIRTTYVARLVSEPDAFVNLLSRPVTVDVRPRVALAAGGGALRVRVHAGRSYAGRVILLQRRANGAWRTERTARLDAHGRASFPQTPGAAVRAYVPPAPGYLAGFSRPLRT